MTPSDPAPEQVDVAALYDRYHAVMHQVARSELKGRDAQADEAVSAVVHSLLTAHAAGRLVPKTDWKAYLVVSVKRAARRIGARETSIAAREISRDDDTITEPSLDSPDPNAARHVDHAADRQVLYGALEKLTPRRRDIVLQRFGEDRSRAEIAALLGISVQAVGDNERQALNQLWKEWADDERPS